MKILKNYQEDITLSTCCDINVIFLKYILIFAKKNKKKEKKIDKEYWDILK